MNPAKLQGSQHNEDDREIKIDETTATSSDNPANPSAERKSNVAGDHVEADLRAGLARAGAEGKWAIVEVLAEQLRAHLEAKAGNVVDLARERAKR